MLRERKPTSCFFVVAVAATYVNTKQKIDIEQKISTQEIKIIFYLIFLSYKKIKIQKRCGGVYICSMNNGHQVAININLSIRFISLKVLTVYNSVLVA